MVAEPVTAPASETDPLTPSDDESKPASPEEQATAAEEGKEPEQELRRERSISELEAIDADPEGVMSSAERRRLDSFKQGQADHRAHLEQAQSETYRGVAAYTEQVAGIVKRELDRSAAREQEPDWEHVSQQINDLAARSGQGLFNTALGSVKGAVQLKLLEIMGDTAEYRAAVKDKDAGELVDLFLMTSDKATYARGYADGRKAGPDPLERKAEVKAAVEPVKAPPAASGAPPSVPTTITKEWAENAPISEVLAYKARQQERERG